MSQRGSLLQSSTAFERPDNFQIFAPDAIKLVMQDGGHVTIAGDDLQPVTNLKILGGGLKFQFAVLSRETYDMDIVTADDDSWFGVRVEGLPPGIDNGTIRGWSRDNGDQHGKCITEVLDVALDRKSTRLNSSH